MGTSRPSDSLKSLSLQNKMKSIVFILFLICCTEANAQHVYRNCKECITTFYELLFADNYDRLESVFDSNRYDFKNHRNYKVMMTKGLSLEEIRKLICESTVSYEAIWLDSLVQLHFPDGDILYFDLWQEGGQEIVDGHVQTFLSDYLISYIYLGNGKELEGTEFLFRPGIINDRDGYTNLRETPHPTARIVGTLKENELFFFIPTTDSNWYSVYRDWGENHLGYVHKSRISTFEKFPKKLKEKTWQIRNGCGNELPKDLEL